MPPSTKKKEQEEIKLLKEIQKLQQSNDLSKIASRLSSILALQDKTCFELNSLF
jgi:hypothetical protein